MDHVDQLLREDEEDEVLLELLQTRSPWMTTPYSRTAPGGSRAGRAPNKPRDYHAYDSIGDNLEISESTVNVCLKWFCLAVIAAFGSEFLRAPTPGEVQKLMKFNGTRGFPGMVGSIDCMHWQWKNCPVYLAGQHNGKAPKPTNVLEAVADHKLRIWHCNFGSPGSLNDINILDQSPLFNSMLRGEAPRVSFRVNGAVDYLRYGRTLWPIFVKLIEQLVGKKKQHFARYQKSARKDVERCFGVLQARWHILVSPCRLWNASAMDIVMQACVILHNMIVEDEYDEVAVSSTNSILNTLEGSMPIVTRPPTFTEPPTIADLIVRSARIHNKQQHFQLQMDLVEHLWKVHGDQE